jgi:DNA-binding GntR family transcriptional regulator
VYEAILSEIMEGKLPPNSRLIQDELAESYGVSRQPVQQALLLLRDHGLVRDAPRRGLVVSPLDVDFIRNLYRIREVLEGLSCREAAASGSKRAGAEGPALVAAGREAVETRSVTKQIAADMAFHCFLYEISGNLLIGETTAPYWHYLRRAMGEVLRDDEKMPDSIWDEHEAILDAIVVGEADKVETLARQHISRAAKIFLARLQTYQEADMADLRPQPRRRIQRQSLRRVQR